MRLIFFLLINFGICGVSAKAQIEKNRIIWRESQPLSWADFKMTPPSNALFHANTNAGISYGWSLQGERDNLSLNYDVFAFFFPELSWVVSNDKSANLLNHEQLHFDICELHARKLRQSLESLPKEKLSGEIRDQLKELYEIIDNQRKEMQARFDRETDHSANREANSRWQNFIQTELKKLEHYQA